MYKYKITKITENNYLMHANNIDKHNQYIRKKQARCKCKKQACEDHARQLRLLYRSIMCV